MAKTIDYGNRTMTKEAKPSGKKPIYLINMDSGQCYCANCQNTFVSDKLAEVSREKDPWSVRNKFRYSDGNNRVIDADAGFTEDDIACPDCGSKGDYDFPSGNGRPADFRSQNNATGERHIDFSKAKYINDSVTGRYVYESKKDNHLTKIEDNIMTENATVFPSGKSFREQKEISIVYDLEKKQIQNSVIYIHNGKREQGPIVDSVDPFMNNPKFKRATRRLSHPAKENYGIHKHVFSILADPKREDGRTLETKRNILFNNNFYNSYNNDVLQYAEINEHIIRELASSIEHKDPAFADPYATKLFLKEHKQDSTKENTGENNSIKYYYATLAVKYPGVLQYIEDAAITEIEDRKKNYERKAEAELCAEKGIDLNSLSPEDRAKTRKDICAEAKSRGMIPEIPDSAKYKIYRENFTRIASQLEAIDDKITASLSKCKTSEEVISVCHSFAFGNKEFTDKVNGTKVTKTGTTPFALRNVDAKAFDNGNGTKAQYQAFKKNPLGTANTMYTLYKMGVTNKDMVDKVLAMTGDSDGCKFRNKSDKQRHYENFMVDFNTIAPIRSREMTSFLKCFMKTKDTRVALEELYDENAYERIKDEKDREGRTIPVSKTLNQWQMFMFDSIEGYKNLMNAKVSFNKISSDQNALSESQIEDNKHIAMKNYIKKYFENGYNIKDAYIAYSEEFGNDTYEQVNTIAREIKKDNAILSMRKDYDTYNAEHNNGWGYNTSETEAYMLDKYPEQLKTPEDIKAMIERADAIEAETTMIDTRNGKPLFGDRNIQELHNEISNMARQIPETNETLVFNENETKLEGEFSGETALEDGAAPKTPEQIEEESHNGLKFNLLKDRFSYIRTSTALHNCLISCDYFSKTKRRNCIICNATDENNQIVGCIEIIPSRDGTYRLNQFQTDNDDAMPERFRTASVKWMEANNIDYASCHDWHRWGDGHKSSRDYHHVEMDEAYSIALPIEKVRERNEARIKKAKEIYGFDENGNINTPEVPEDLTEFV